MLVNFTNHPSSQWGEAITGSGKVRGHRGCPFSRCGPGGDEAYIGVLASEYAERIRNLVPDAVLCQGEFCLVYRVVSLLKEKNITVLAAGKVLNAEEMLDYKRRHRAIENCLHYVLDETFGEDKSTIKLGKNTMSLLRKCAYNITRLFQMENPEKQEGIPDIIDNVCDNLEIGFQMIFRNQLQFLAAYVMIMSLQKFSFFITAQAVGFTVLCHVACGFYEESLIWAFCLK